MTSDHEINAIFSNRANTAVSTLHGPRSCFIVQMSWELAGSTECSYGLTLGLTYFHANTRYFHNAPVYQYRR